MRWFKKTVERAAEPSVPEMDIYTVVSCDELFNLEPSCITRTPWLPDIEVSIPTISSGQRKVPTFEIKEFPENNWFEPSYSVQDGFSYEIRDAVVHRELGVITVGRFLLRESLHLVLPEFQGFRWIDNHTLEMPAVPKSRHVEHALHALCGYVGNRNYAHWWIDIVPVLGEHLLYGLGAGAKILMPKIRTVYQKQTLELAPELAPNSIFIQEDESITCDRLIFVPRLLASDYTPHSRSINFIRHLIAKMNIDLRRDRKIYLSRKDASARKLLNEADVCNVMAEAGYEIHETGDYSVSRQIELFASAHTIVSPHGAGLANMLFAPPWVRVIEFHYDRSINWSLRRLTSIIPATYGCIVGHQKPKDLMQSKQDAEQNPWSINIAEVKDLFPRVPHA